MYNFLGYDIDDGTHVQIVHSSPTPNTDEYLRLLQLYWAYWPLIITCCTLEAITQLAQPRNHTPLRRHLQSWFPFLNRFRLNENVSTDPIFGQIPRISLVCRVYTFMSMG